MAKTAAGLVTYCKAQLGRPYWWGTFGQISTKALYETKRGQYPSYYTADNFLQQLGVKVHDCVGLIKGYLWSATPETPAMYNPAQDVNVQGLYNVCSRYGSIGAMPNEPGTCVFMRSMGHVGVYIGGGEVIEAMGHANGVVKTKLQGRGWAFWGQPKWISYETIQTDQPKPEIPPDNTQGSGVQMDTGEKWTYHRPHTYSIGLPLLIQSDYAPEVGTAQILLNAKGYNCGEVDNDFGPATAEQVKAYQRASGLDDDGEIGGDTWDKLLGGD